MSPIVPPLADVFALIPDPRHARGKRHPLVALLLLACVAMLTGARGPSGIADWAKNYGEPWRARLGLTHRKGPSQSTLQRIFAHIAIETVEAQLARWAQQVIAALPPTDPTTLDGVAMDGKALRMSARCGASDPHLLSLYSHRLGLVLAQLAVVDKTNEITASDEILARFLLTGAVLTGDAIFTQTAIAQTLLAQGNDYLLVVKENQPTLHDDLATLFADPRCASASGRAARHAQPADRAPPLGGLDGTGRVQRLAGTGTGAVHRAAGHGHAHRADERRRCLCGHLTATRAGNTPATADLVACALADRESAALCPRCDLWGGSGNSTHGRGAAGISGDPQSGDWATAIGRRDEHRCGVSPLRRPTRARPRRCRDHLTTLNKPWIR